MGKMTKAEAGRLGGRSTVRKHGRGHMRKIGRAGARAFWDRYRVVPLGTSSWAIVCKETDEIVATRP